MTKIRRNVLRRCGSLARVLLLLFVLSAVLVAVTFKLAIAKTEDSLLELGRHLAVVAEHGLGKDARGVSINRQSMGFRVLTTDQAMDSVLDFYEIWCREGSGILADELDLIHGLDESFSIDRSWRDMTMRDSEEGRGFVACIQQNGGRPSTQGLANKLDLFNMSGDLSELGRFHYAYVSEEGDHRLIIAIWTEGPFFPYKLFPAKGDAPGYDVRGIPRPPTGRRSLSAGELGHAETLTVYIESDESSAELAAFYRKAFRDNRWTILLDTVTSDGQRFFAVEREGKTRYLEIGRHEGQGWVAIGNGN